MSRYTEYSRKKVCMLFYIIAIIVIAVDQLTKVLVRIHVDMYERFTLLGIEFTHIENSGMAGGLFPGYAPLFGIIAIGFVLFVFYLRRNNEWRGPIIDCSLGFLVGGAIGNGIDRLLFGQVTDFIVRSGGVLNIADHALELGIILLIIYELVQWRRQKKAKKKSKEVNKMIATIEEVQDVKAAVYTRSLHHSPETVWTYLTENNKLQQWFSELEIDSLKPSGQITFDFGNGTYERMDIFEVETNKLFSFSWPPKNSVSFELKKTDQGCDLIFKEVLHEVNRHTAKDLTGWHVCLHVIEALLDGKTVEDRKAEWEQQYPAYQELLKTSGLWSEQE